MKVIRCSQASEVMGEILGGSPVSAIQDFALEVLDKLVRSVKHEPTAIVFSWNPFECTGGGYSPEKDAIYVNLSLLRTTRDIVYVIAHEYAHLMQTRRYGVQAMIEAAEKDIQSKPVTEKDFYEYLFSDVEQEADVFAFDFENSLDYKSIVVNRFVPISYFVDRKTNIAFAPA